MLAHRLRHRVDIEKQVHEQNPATGRVKTTWEPFMSDVPAEVLTGPGRERVASGAVQAEVAARINLRWFPGLDPSMRVVWDGRKFNISSIETDVTARREYRLICAASVDEGI